MVRKTFGFVLVCAFACGAMAAERSQSKQAGNPNVIAVSELLKRAAKSPLARGDAGILRAVAELIEQEQTPGPHAVGKGGVPTAVISYDPVPAPALPPPSGSPVERKRLAVRLINAPVDDVAKAVQDSVKGEQHRVILVPEQVSNTLLISGTPKMVNALTRQIAKLDARPPMVMAQVCIANFVIPRSDAKPHEGSSDDPVAAKTPSREDDGAAWLEWARKQGRLEVLSRPQIMTLENQPAWIQVGGPAPGSVPKAGTEPAKVGVSMDLTPRISPEGLIVMELDVEHASVVSRDGAGEPIIGKTTVQTTISAKHGQTVIVGGITQRSEDGHRQLIVAVTPRVVVHQAEAERSAKVR